MSRYVESLKRLYTNNKITDAQLLTLKTNELITQEQYDYIIA